MDMASPDPLMTRSSGRLVRSGLIFAIGLFWAIMGVGKALQVFLGIGAPTADSWVGQFPIELLGLISLLEMWLAWLLWSGRALLGLKLAIGALVVFTFVLFVNPPLPTESCGCGGALSGAVADVNPLARNSALIGLHALAIALVMPVRPGSMSPGTTTDIAKRLA